MAETTRATGRRGRLLALLIGVFVVVVVLDQITKAMAVAWLEPLAGTDRPRVAVLGDLAGFQFLRNPGAAFGIGTGMTWLLIIIASAVIVVVIVVARRLGSLGWSLAFGLLLGGALGNLSDRFFRQGIDGGQGFGQGAVVDFIDLHFFTCNVADIAITAAAVLMVLLSFRGIGVDGIRTGDGDAAAPGTVTAVPSENDDSENLLQKDGGSDAGNPAEPDESKRSGDG